VLKEMEQPEPVFSTALPQPNEWTLPSLSYGPSKEVPSFSSAVNLEYSQQLGRHLVANKSIKTGNGLINKLNAKFVNIYTN